MPALGERFRAAREARGLTLSDVAEQIRIRSVYLAAIEDENWPAIGAPVYVRGFLRTYARFLGLDPEETVASFNAASDAAPAPAPGGAHQRANYRADTAEAQPRNLSPLLWILSLVAVGLIAFLVYNEMTFHSAGSTLAASTPSPDASASPPDAAGSVNPEGSPSQSPAASPSATPSPGVVAQSLELRLSAPSWIRVTIDGNVSMEGTFPAGTDRLFHGKNARLRIGNAGGVEVVVDGKPLGTLGPTGDVVDRSFAL
jgi:cytoskeleton protein RodZ